MHIDQAFFYAGIGSRETPAHILDIMRYLGCYLCEKGWILRSGAALGADKAFEDATNLIKNAGRNPHDNFKEIYLPWPGYNNSHSELHPTKYPFSEQEVNFSVQFHPAWNKLSPGGQKLQCRNTRIMLGLGPIHGAEVKPVSFVVCWTPNGAATGGTGQALRIAKACKIPIINLGLAKSPDELQGLIIHVDRLQDEIMNGTKETVQ
jgi:hypothetical protein